MHTDSWLYKNYNKPFTESDTNGIVVAFDPTRKNALLHQQVKALQERMQFDRRVIAKADTASALLSIAEEAWHEGYEHLAVLTSDDRISEVNRFLQDRCGKAFETIIVVPEISPRAFASPRLYEVDMAALGQAAGAEAEPAEQPQEQDKAGTPISLFLIQANPPVAGTSKILEMGQQALKKMKAPEATYAIHNTNIDKSYAFTSKFRSNLIRGNEGNNDPSLYGKGGFKAISDTMSMNGRSTISLEYMSLADAILQHPKLKGREIAAVVVPEDAYPHINFGNLDPNRIEVIKQPGDAFTPQHKQLIDLGRKIFADCPIVKDKKEDIVLKKDEVTEADTIALYILNACHYSTKLSGEEFDKKMSLTWGAIDSGTKEFAKELGELSGISTMASGIKDIVDTVGKVAKAEEPDKAHQMQAALNGLENMGFDVMKAVNHAEYAKFFKGLDLA